MGCMLRSDPMTLCGMYLQPEAAFDVLSRLGEMGCVQFVDMHPDLQLFQRQYVIEVCRYSEMERRLKTIEREMKLHNIEIQEQTTESIATPLNEMITFENMIEKWEQDIQDMTLNEVNLLKSYFELNEFYYVLTYIGPLLGESEIQKESMLNSRKAAAKAGAAGDVGVGVGGRLVVITGAVRRNKCYAFEMMLWRISHGIIYYKQASEDKILIDPQSRQEIRKVAFLAICQGEALTERIQKICDGFQVNIFPCPNTPQERMELQEKLQTRITDLDQVLKKTRYHRCKTLRTVSKNWRLWMGQVRKAKAIYHAMNMFRYEKCLIGEAWIPNSDLDAVNTVLHSCSESFQSSVPSFASKIETTQMPPTYHRTNKFTRGFQNLINAYGDSTYRELNPGLHTLITFPFLFSMMFGDMGHGLILVGFGSWMCKNEKLFISQRSTNEIWNIFFGGRYVILMMGLSSMFTGFVYNDLFSKAFCLTSSYWLNIHSVEDLAKDEYFDLNPSFETGRPYMFGKDPIWTLAKNKIMFENSTKMKLSIIVGIIHMIFGISLSFFNYRYFRRTYSIFLQFIPEILFLTLLFLWLVLLIYIKWFLYTAKSADQERNTSCAPQILILFIDMVLMTESKPSTEGCKEAYMFDNQRTVQMTLVFTALVCVPILLLGTPIYKIRKNKRKREAAKLNLRAYRNSARVDKKIEEHLEAEVEKYSTSVGELMIHQGVHTIEFVLSTISHTASYLRLWALSLAHAQLSEMLWGMVLSKLALQDHSAIGSIKLVFIFALWALFTVSILVVMEGLSAFLHCLRLHWVEFMSKFYIGGGWPFRPFSFKVILTAEIDKPEPGCRKLLSPD
ncbi:V-type proton ATPase 116 kDa subunit a 1 [Helicoverpa armigera]|uniref:V-type proton ATPase 116 kDa subunit a 1 n=1 Tax=Helicoverpa armigera TaxID=29058 RepID=UPI00211102B7|nr:V-type proton ATPase 116 kDa subunit a 1 [Helicoverpa armigera]